MITPDILTRLAKMFARMQKKRAGGAIGDPRRFDGDFSLNQQAEAIRRAERKRACKARLRRLTR